MPPSSQPAATVGLPINVVLTRGEVDESVHVVEAVVANVEGTQTIWGRGDRPVIARSALKFVQAVPLVRSGAADRYDLQDHELVLACASHSAEAEHVDAVEGWLARIGLGVDALECGADRPIDDGAADRLVADGGRPAAIHNCCSGKHAGFLTVARHLGIDHAGYIWPDHPVQRLVTEAVEEFTGHPLGDQQPGCDGCGIPTFGIPLASLARAMVAIGAAEAAGLDQAAVQAADRLVRANIGRQFWISGTGRHETVLAAAAEEPLLVKGGAEGVFMAGLPDRGIGIAVKALDGSGRAAELAMSFVLGELGVVPAEMAGRTVSTKAGHPTGHLKAVVSGRAKTEPGA